jgi:hypothetical protein
MDGERVAAAGGRNESTGYEVKCVGRAEMCGGRGAMWREKCNLAGEEDKFFLCR